MKVRGSVLASAAFLTGCSVDQIGVSSRSIIGGQTSESGEFAATGMLVVAERLACTATLIAPDVAVTAAHCLGEPEFGDFGFTLDTDAGDGVDGIVPVRVVHQHPDFDAASDGYLDLSVRNDVGVIILAQPVTEVPPELIDEPALETQLAAGDKLAICGYGRSAWYTGDTPIKRDAEVAIDRTDAYEFATTPVDPQPCIGDSGAPLFAGSPDGRHIVGLVSRAMGRSRMCDTGAIITRLGPYSKWIERASQDRDTGCSAGGGGAGLSLGVLAALHAARRRRRS